MLLAFYISTFQDNHFIKKYLCNLGTLTTSLSESHVLCSVFFWKDFRIVLWKLFFLATIPCAKCWWSIRFARVATPWIEPRASTPYLEWNRFVANEIITKVRYENLTEKYFLRNQPRKGLNNEQVSNTYLKTAIPCQMATYILLPTNARNGSSWFKGSTGLECDRERLAHIFRRDGHRNIEQEILESQIDTRTECAFWWKRKWKSLWHSPRTR